MTEKPARRFTFKKPERLNRKKHIKELFEEGSSFFLHPFKVLYLERNEKEANQNQILISVPKRQIRSAVSRNLVKRRIREAYRLNGYILSEGTDKKFLIAYIYAGRDILDFKHIESKLKKVLIRLRDMNRGKKSPDSEQ